MPSKTDARLPVHLFADALKDAQAPTQKERNRLAAEATQVPSLSFTETLALPFSYASSKALPPNLLNA